MTGRSVVKAASPFAGALPRDEERLPTLGEWFWVKATKDEDDVEKGEKRWLGAVTHVGSNYLQVTGYAGSEYGGRNSQRIHFDVLHRWLTPEPDAEAILAAKIAQHHGRARELMGEVQEITKRLAVQPNAITDGSGGNETQALAVRGGGQGIEEYKQALIRAKTKQLPELFKAIEKENKVAAHWMTAKLIPLEAQAESMKPVIKSIEDRIFSVELYAGLTENVTQVTDGAPARFDEKIMLMQRRAYMDEECLAQYEAGGMEFEDIHAFDEWIARSENRNRLLPGQRCITAFRVRRREKERSWEGIGGFIRMFYEAEADMQTYLYIRNGEQLFRLSTKIDFGEQLFPDMDHLDTSQPLYVKQGRASHESNYIITEGMYLTWLAEDEAHAATERKGRGRYARTQCRCTDADRVRYPDSNPDHFYCRYRDRASGYELYSPDSVFYDDATKHLLDEQARHNRLVLVLQGLLDRSPVLQPHPQWKLWTPEGFMAGLNPIYDSSRAIANGDAPDFESYRARLNATIRPGTITVGQEQAWEEAEAARYNALDKRGSYRYHRYRPDDDPGPGTVARVATIKPRTKACVFRWVKRTERWNRYEGTTFRETAKSVAVPIGKLLNVETYTPGDFHRFFDDPRTRADYLKWAPLLLVAEDYHAGKRSLPPLPESPKMKQRREK